LQKDILVLENVPERRPNDQLRQQVGNLGWLVIDLIDCERNSGLENALFEFAGKKVVCETLEEARIL